MRPAVHAVVLTYGGPQVAVAVVQSIRAAGIDAEQVIVVDNPARPSADRGPSDIHGSPVFYRPENDGYGAGMNAGVSRLNVDSNDLILLCTPDLSIMKGCVEEMVRVLASEAEVALVGPTLLNADGSVFSGGGRASRGDYSHIKNRPAGLGHCDWVDGAMVLVRASAFLSVSGFDESLFLYFEDADLGTRLRHRGLGVACVGTASAQQEPGALTRPFLWNYLRARNGPEMALRHFGRAAAMKIALGIGASDFATNASRVVHTRGREIEPWLAMRATGRGLFHFATRRKRRSLKRHA